MDALAAGMEVLGSIRPRILWILDAGGLGKLVI